MSEQTSIFQPKSISDIYINISHFLDHFMMLIFAKAAYDAGKYFGLTYDEIIKVAEERTENILFEKTKIPISEIMPNDNVKEYSTKANKDIINDVYTSYDLSLNSKYKVKIFNQTIDRVKNYFR